MKEFKGVFPEELPKHVPPDRGLGKVHEIPIKPGKEPIARKMCRHNLKEQLLIKWLLDELVSAGAIRSSSSPWDAPVLYAKKTYGSLRFCVDSRTLNAVNITDKYPLPNHEDLTDQLAEAKYFSSLDLRSGYW